MSRPATGRLLAVLLTMLLSSAAGGCQRSPRPLSGADAQAQAATAAAGTGCDGADGAFTFAVTGTVSGPYPGTLDESGSVAITAGQVTHLDGTFTIRSSPDTITGSFQLAPGAQGGFCMPATGQAAATLTYRAAVRGNRNGTLTGSLALSVASGSLTGAQLRETFS